MGGFLLDSKLYFFNSDQPLREYAARGGLVGKQYP